MRSPTDSTLGRPNSRHRKTAPRPNPAQHAGGQEDRSTATGGGTALATDPGVVFLQYVPNALGAKGGNVAFCQWLLSLRRQGTDIRVMFHEPYFYLSWNPALNTLARVQRMMAAILLRAVLRPPRSQLVMRLARLPAGGWSLPSSHPHRVRRHPDAREGSPSTYPARGSSRTELVGADS